MTVASFTDAGMQGVRLMKKKRIIKGVPRMMGSHARESYWVFQGLTTSLEAGEALVLVSRDPVRTNAVLRVWAGILPIDAGQVQRPQRSLLLIPPQSKWLREMSVEQTIRLLAGIYGLRDEEVEAIVGNVADTAGVADLMHLPLDELGRQYAHQIAFAIAIHAPVPVVMFDHTATMGSRDFRHSCLDRLVALRDSGKALVVATDKPKAALHVGTKAVIVRGKRADEVPVSEAAEFLIRDRIKGKKKTRRRFEDDEDDGGLGF
jgi:ABC-type polysaccharide/polyol phosphate transport system ATPase subunit